MIEDANIVDICWALGTNNNDLTTKFGPALYEVTFKSNGSTLTLIGGVTLHRSFLIANSTCTRNGCDRLATQKNRKKDQL